MTEKTDSLSVSMTNTKKELLDAYGVIKRQLEEREKAVLDAEKARKQAEKQAALAVADAQSSQDPLQRLYDLRGAFGRELTALADRFEEEMATYQKVQAAVKEKQAELNTIYQVEAAASDLAALIEAQQSRKKDFDAEIECRHSTFEEEMREAQAKWNREKAERDQEAREQAEAIKKQRQREKEDYEYAFAREKEQRKNALDDELKVLEKQIEQKRRDFQQELDQRQAEIEVREEATTRQEEELKTLRREVDAFPERLRQEVDTAKAVASERLTSDFQKEKALLEARYEGEKNVLSRSIEALERLTKAQEAQLKDLVVRHEKAYEKVQDIANRAVEASKREYISVPVHAPGPGQAEKG